MLYKNKKTSAIIVMTEVINLENREISLLV